VARIVLSLPVEVIVMQLGSFLFVIAFAVILIGPIAGLLLGLISRANQSSSAAPRPLEERPS
jgi:hypothetical protein